MRTIVYMSLCLLCSAPILADRHVNLWQDDANLYVVLVRFHGMDPHGWVNGLSTDSAYTLEDFQRLFGEAGAPGFGTTDVHSVAETTEPLPTLYGSVKDYFEYLSGGEFTIVPKVLNPSNAQGISNVVGTGPPKVPLHGRWHKSWRHGHFRGFVRHTKASHGAAGPSQGFGPTEAVFNILGQRLATLVEEEQSLSHRMHLPMVGR